MNLVYPHFEVTNTDWLKYALLYKESITTIVPEGTDFQPSDVNKRLQDIDFLNYYNPKEEDKELAKNSFFSLFEEITNLEELFKREKYIYTLYNSKMSNEIIEFLKNRELGSFTKDYSNFNTSKDLAYLYMSYLAKSILINEGKNGTKFDLVCEESGHRKIKAIEREISIIKGDEINQIYNNSNLVLNEIIPSKISQIDINEFIDLRKDKTFNESIKYYNETLRLYTGNHSQFNANFFLKDLNEARTDIKSQLIKYGFKQLVSTATIVVSISGGQLLPAISSILAVMSDRPKSTVKISQNSQIDSIHVKNTVQYITKVKNQFPVNRYGNTRMERYH